MACRLFVSLLLIFASIFPPYALAADKSSISGSLITGSGSSGTALVAVPITLYLLGPSDPLPVASTISDSTGHFSLPVANVAPSGIYLISAAVNQWVELTALIGHTLPAADITVNEKTSVSAAYALAQFARSGKVTRQFFSAGRCLQNGG